MSTNVTHKVFPESNDLISRKPRPNSPTDPIATLALEIATMIFDVFALSAGRTQVQNLFLLGSVCKSWRNTIWATPSLWRKLVLFPKASNLIETTKITQECLDRSGNVPVTIYIFVNAENNPLSNPELWDAHMDQFTRFADTVKAVSARWQAICLDMPAILLEKFYGTDISKLKRISVLNNDHGQHTDSDDESDTLEVYTPHLNDSHYLGSGDAIKKYPQPNRLIIDGILLRSIEASWASLTTVFATSIDIEDVFTLLHEAPLLERFVLTEDRIGPYTMAESKQVATIVHGSLTTFCLLTNDEEYANMLFGVLTLPRLTNFILMLDETGLLDHECYIAFYKRSSCQLASLTFRGFFGDSLDLVAMLSIAPTISHLTLLPCNNIETDPDLPSRALFKKLAESSQKLLPDGHPDSSNSLILLPVLQCFIYDPVCPDDCDTCMWDFIIQSFSLVKQSDNTVSSNFNEDLLIRPLKHFYTAYNPSKQGWPRPPPEFTEDLEENEGRHCFEIIGSGENVTLEWPNLTGDERASDIIVRKCQACSLVRPEILFHVIN